MSFQYIPNVGSLKEFLGKIPLVGVPDKVTQKFLVTLGFKSTNDRPIIRVLKFLNFIDSSGVPTEKYKRFRDKSKSAKVLGEAIKESYSELFKVYPDASVKDPSTLKDFFRTSNPNLGDRTVRLVVDTFRTLVSLAEFEDSFSNDQQLEINPNKEEITGSGKEALTDMHAFTIALGAGRVVKIYAPADISGAEITKVTKMLEALV